MEALNALIAGFGVALQPMNLMWGFIGVTLGTFVGVLPGVGPALTVSGSSIATVRTITTCGVKWRARVDECQSGLATSNATVIRSPFENGRVPCHM